jgi:hypothetical protein
LQRRDLALAVILNDLLGVEPARRLRIGGITVDSRAVFPRFGVILSQVTSILSVLRDARACARGDKDRAVRCSESKANRQHKNRAS